MNLKSRSILITLTIASLLISAKFSHAEHDHSYTKEVVSRIFHVDRRYPSMRGPRTELELRLGSNTEEELLWVTGYEAVVTDDTGTNTLSGEYLCHSNVFASSRAKQLLFNLSQGQQQIILPDGFGIPVRASEPLELVTQVLNLNPGETPINLRFKLRVHFLRDREQARPMTPLTAKAAFSMALLKGPDGDYGMEPGSQNSHAECSHGEQASSSLYEDEFGRKFTGHWLLKPGREVNRTLITNRFALPFDTTMHYVAVHVHPYAESIELRDVTANLTLFKSNITRFESRSGIAELPHFSSSEGVSLYRKHQYEIITVNNNDTNEVQDSMGMLVIYYVDRDFQRRPSS